MSKEDIKKVEEFGVVKESHPSYGAIRINMPSGTRNDLYGTTTEQHGYVTITIAEAHNERRYHEDKSFEKGLTKNVIAQVDMSAHQFSELLVSSGSLGNGVPCTVRVRNGERIKPVEIESTMEKFSMEYKEIVDSASNVFNGILNDFKEATNTKGMIKKADVAEMQSKLEKAVSRMNESIPFFFQMFNEQIDKTIIEMKHDITAYNDRQVRNAGLEALGLKGIDYSDFGGTTVQRIPVNNKDLSRIDKTHNAYMDKWKPHKDSIEWYRKEGFFGKDASLEVSLFEHGVIGRIIGGIIVIVYGISKDESGNFTEFDITSVEKDLDVLSEYDFINEKEFFTHIGLSIPEWEKEETLLKICDVVSYYGSQNLFGPSYGGEFVISDPDEE